MPPKQSVTNTRHAPQTVRRAVPRTPLSTAFVWPFITISPLCCRQPLYFAKYIANHVSRFPPPASGFTHHVSRLTFHVSRFTFHVSRFTHHARIPFPASLLPLTSVQTLSPLLNCPSW